MKHKILLSVAVSALIAAESIAAESETTNEVATLPTVVVTASPITQKESISKDGIETTVVSDSQLHNLNAQDIQSALRQVPGITISRYAPIGSYGGAQGGSVYVRGLGTARPGGEVRMYTDGAPRESGMWGHPLMDSVPIDFAKTVTVQKNPHSGGFSGTFGAVDVETRRRTEQGYEGEVDLVYGRRNTFLSAASAGIKEGPVDAYAGMSYKRSDGTRDHNDAMLESAFARLGVDFTENDHLGFVYQRTDSRVEDPGEIWSRTPILNRFDLSTDLYTFRFDTDRETLKGFSLAYVENGVINWHKDHMDDSKPQSPAGDCDTFWLNWGVRNRYDWNPFAGLWLTGGIDVNDDGGSTRNTRLSDESVVFSARGRTVTTSPYLGLRYDFDLGEEWTLTPSAGVRQHFNTQYDDETAPNAALVLDWHDKAEFFVNGSRGVHYPGIYTRAMADDYARNTLDAEIMDYVATGVKVKACDDADVLASVFHTDVKDRIDKTATGYINAGSMRASGVEASAHWCPLSCLALFGGGTFTNPETGPVSRLPRWTFTLGGTWKICEWLSWTLDGQYIDEMNAYSVRAEADRANLRTIGETFIFNTRVSVPLKAFSPFDGDVFVSIENLADRSYEYYPGYPTGGIMWYVGTKFRF